MNRRYDLRPGHRYAWRWQQIVGLSTKLWVRSWPDNPSAFVDSVRETRLQRRYGWQLFPAYYDPRNASSTVA